MTLALILLMVLILMGGLLFFARPAKAMLAPVAAAAALGLAGYAWQGRPDIAEARASPVKAGNKTAEILIEFRKSMDQNFIGSERWLITADGFTRSGNYRMAAAMIQAGIKEQPRNADLWSALGLVLMLASEGEVTAPAKLAFQKARALSPQRPQADYFEGLAALAKGDLATTEKLWQGALDRATPKADYRMQLESQLAVVKQQKTMSKNGSNLSN